MQFRLCESCQVPYTAGKDRHLNARFCSLRCTGRSRWGNIQARLESKVEKVGECWIWTGTTDEWGYGRLGFAGKVLRVHRAAWEQVAPPLTSSQPILHTCDIPACFRNDDVGTYTVRGETYERHGHLYLATHKANVHDMVDKGRHRNGRGTKLRR